MQGRGKEQVQQQSARFCRSTSQANVASMQYSMGSRGMGTAYLSVYVILGGFCYIYYEMYIFELFGINLSIMRLLVLGKVVRSVKSAVNRMILCIVT
jgi:hypothetical protein